VGEFGLASGAGLEWVGIGEGYLVSFGNIADSVQGDGEGGEGPDVGGAREQEVLHLKRFGMARRVVGVGCNSLILRERLWNLREVPVEIEDNNVNVFALEHLCPRPPPPGISTQLKMMTQFMSRCIYSFGSPLSSLDRRTQGLLSLRVLRGSGSGLVTE